MEEAIFPPTAALMKDIERERLLIRQYLLGELDEHEREQLEQRVITHPDYKEEVLITEEELLEDFVNGTLSPRELELFKKMYSSPAQSRKVKIAQALSTYASEQSPVVQPVVHKTWTRSLFEIFSTKKRFRRFSLAALITVLAVGGAILVYWLISQQWRENYEALRQLNQTGSEILQPNSSVVSVSLPSLLLREGGGEARNITLGGQTRTVQFRLRVPSGGTSSFRATLKESDGSEIFRLDDLRARQIGPDLLLVLQIPAKMLTSQDYQLEISERLPDGAYGSPSTYPFHVTGTP